MLVVWQRHYCSYYDMLLVQLMFDDIHIHVIVAVVIFVSGPQASYE